MFFAFFLSFIFVLTFAYVMWKILRPFQRHYVQKNVQLSRNKDKKENIIVRYIPEMSAPSSPCSTPRACLHSGFKRHRMCPGRTSSFLRYNMHASIWVVRPVLLSKQPNTRCKQGNSHPFSQNPYWGFSRDTSQK